MKYFENWKNWEKWFYLLSMCSENHLDLVFQVLGGMMLYCIWEKSINGIEYEKNYKQLKIWESKKDYLNTYNHEFIHACACSAVSWLFATLWTIVPQAPLSTGFTRQEYWSRLPFPPSGDLRPTPTPPGLEPEAPVSPALQVDSLAGSSQMILMMLV